MSEYVIVLVRPGMGYTLADNSFGTKSKKALLKHLQNIGKIGITPGGTIIK